MTHVRKVTSEEKEKIAALLGVDISKIPGEVDWDDNDEDENEDDDIEDDEELEDDDIDEDDDVEDDEEDEDEDEVSAADSIRESIVAWSASGRTIPFSEFLKQRGM